nr:MAG TPA: hypothetical protein [Caudoviricetes sp.]
MSFHKRKAPRHRDDAGGLCLVCVAGKKRTPMAGYAMGVLFWCGRWDLNQNCFDLPLKFPARKL